MSSGKEGLPDWACITDYTFGMKHLFSLLLAIFLGLCPPGAAAAQTPSGPALNAQAWMLYDISTTQVLAEQNADRRIDPGALSRLMLSYITFTALRDHTLDENQLLSAPPADLRAAPRLFPPGGRLTVGEAIQALLLAEPNDATRALVNAVAGNEAACYALMDQEAQRLGLSGSQFHSLGTPASGHYSTVRDLVRLATYLQRDFPERNELYRRKEFRIGGQPLLNPNHLLWLDPSVEGILAGDTAIAATATRGPRRLLAVVTGNTGRVALAQEAQRLLNSGFQDFDTVRVYAGGEMVDRLEVRRGRLHMVKVGFLRDLHVAVTRGRADDLHAQLASRRPLLAPLRRGDTVGSVTVSLDGRALGTYPLVALEEIPAANWFQRQWDSLMLWLK